MKLTDYARKLNAIKEAYFTEAEQIKAIERYSADYKNKLIAGKREEMMRNVLSIIDQLKGDIKSKLESAREAKPAIDLNNTALINSITMLKSLKGETPNTFTLAMIDTFKKDRSAISALMPLFTEYGLVVPAIEAEKILNKPNQYQRLLSVDDMIYYCAMDEKHIFSDSEMRMMDDADTPDNEIDS